jgi:hypothetical protein
MNWQSRLEKTVIALNLIGLALGFNTLGILILMKREHGAESWISGVLGIIVGSLFLLLAFYFCRHTWGRWLEKVSLGAQGDYFLAHHDGDAPRQTEKLRQHLRPPLRLKHQGEQRWMFEDKSDVNQRRFPQL